MADTKNNKKITKRSFTFFGGIAFCLFAVVLILNVGYIARAIAFPFVYAFGLGSYAIYILIYTYGLFLFFREKGFEVDSQGNVSLYHATPVENADKINLDYILTEDIMFKSSSSAAAFVSASSLNGKICWKIFAT